MLKLNCSHAQKKLIWNQYFLFLRSVLDEKLLSVIIQVNTTCMMTESRLSLPESFLISFSRDTVTADDSLSWSACLKTHAVTAAALKHGYRNMKQWEIVNKSIITNSTSEYPTAVCGGLGSLDLRYIIKISKKRTMERKEVMHGVQDPASEQWTSTRTSSLLLLPYWWKHRIHP